MPTTLRTMLMLATVLWTAQGCAHRAPKVDAPLGKVVVYRNGVAYFERRATVDGSFSLQVPRERVDDFLKSLTVVDLSDGSPLSVSYRTPNQSSARSLTMELVLPEGKRDVLITYVTESPAWKPSYRVLLEDDGKATLQSLAVVDNVSTEAWDSVRVGVGTTSALSFRYDLHSVRMVERETVDEGRLLAKAPPKGGSAYAVDGEEKRVLLQIGEVDLSDPSIGSSISMEEFSKIPVGAGREFTQAVESSATASRDSAGIRQGGSNAETEYSPTPPEPPLQRLSKQLAGSSQRVLIEGYRLPDETDEAAALRRANTMREQLIASGVDARQIDVAEGKGVVESRSDVIRVTAIEEGPAFTQAVSEEGDEAPRGTALFVAEDPLSLDVGHSAMVTLLEDQTTARRVYLYDPTTERGSTRFAFNAVRIVNPTDHTLDPGPVTVYADGQYLGEGLAETIPPRAHALVPFALDRMVRVRTTTETSDEIQDVLSVRRGVATTNTERIRSTTLKLHNRGTDDAAIFVRHHVPSGWTPRDLPEDAERYGDDLLLPVQVQAGERASIELSASMPLQSTLYLKSPEDMTLLETYLASGRASSSVAPQLRALLKAHDEAALIDTKLQAAAENVTALRVRVQELRTQLVLLRKSKRAQSLSGHLAKRMREVSDALDEALLEAAELKDQRLRARVELSSVVAEFSVEDPDTVATRG